MQNGKSDKPRNCFSKQFKDNYESIEWRDKGSFCHNCGSSIKKENLTYRKESYIFYSDGNIAHVNCNYN